MRRGYRVGPSRIHGMGVFAVRAFRRGDRVGVIRGRVARRFRPGKGNLYAVELDSGGYIVPQKIPSGLWLLNHGCGANAVLVVKRRTVDVIAARAIRPGTEITCDYRPSFHEGTLECRCGSNGCSGRI